MNLNILKKTQTNKKPLPSVNFIFFLLVPRRLCP